MTEPAVEMPLSHSQSHVYAFGGVDLTQTLSEPAEGLTGAYSDIEYRGKNEGPQVVNVSFPKRLVELIVMPYETETTIGTPDGSYQEICSRSAFDGIQAKNDRFRVRVNRDHDAARTVGRAVALHPSRQEGLVAEVHISETVLGEETLILADDGVLDASAGFKLLRKDGPTGPIVPNAVVWETQTRARLNKLWLDHIALTPAPAYPTAHVLAVREKTQIDPVHVARTNREKLELEKWERMEADLNGRYSPGQHQPPAV